MLWEEKDFSCTFNLKKNFLEVDKFVSLDEIKVLRH